MTGTTPPPLGSRPLSQVRTEVVVGRPAVADDIVTRLRVKDGVYTEFWQQQLMDEAADEIERLRAAIGTVIAAIDKKGPHPGYHDALTAQHRAEWPTLWQAIDNLREARRG